LKFCRFETDGAVHLGVLSEGRLYDLTSQDRVVFADLHSAYSKARALGKDLPSLAAPFLSRAGSIGYEESLLRIPIEFPEIWAAGVTYLRSREARETETKLKGIYDHVYSAERPELFVKDTGIRCRGPGEEVCVRSDSRWSVPEPELTAVLDREGNILGYTAGNDVSSRDVEGENPLYLPQAKVYLGSSSIGPVVTTADEVRDPQSLRISMRISRSGRVIFEGEVNTSQMRRSVGELVSFLKRDNVLKDFTLLMTGTSIVPPDDFTLKGGDVVEIDVEGIGTLRNPVRQL
jgi:2-dehydro-3-deoxy-D-arabinonate dehydratase